VGDEYGGNIIIKSSRGQCKGHHQQDEGWNIQVTPLGAQHKEFVVRSMV
jgi:hypothetical protein